MCKYTKCTLHTKNKIMNGAYTPALMKKMTHPITKKYKSCALKKMEQDVKVVGNNRADSVLTKLSDTQYTDHHVKDYVRRKNEQTYKEIANRPASADMTGQEKDKGLFRNLSASVGSLKTLIQNIGNKNNRVDNVLPKNGDDKRPEGVVQEAFKAPVTTTQYPTITSADSTKIRGAYEYLKSPDLKRQQILDNSGSSATVEEADSYRVNQLRNFSKKYGINAVKGVGNNKN